jgi:hypothetical protein
MNPIEFLKNYMTKGMTPKGIVKRITGNNPIFSNLVNMADKGDNKGVETFARNFLKEKGMDYDKEMANFKNKLGIN